MSKYDIYCENALLEICVYLVTYVSKRVTFEGIHRICVLRERFIKNAIYTNAIIYRNIFGTNIYPMAKHLKNSLEESQNRQNNV